MSIAQHTHKHHHTHTHNMRPLSPVSVRDVSTTASQAVDEQHELTPPQAAEILDDRRVKTIRPLIPYVAPRGNR